MARQMGSTDEFLNHKGSGGGGGNYLRKWKEKGKLDVWLHTKKLPIALWQHQFPRFIVREDKDTGDTTKQVWSMSYNCHEDESILKRQYRRNDDDEREVPPRKCPMCKLIEAVRKMVREEKISWVKPIFRFEGSDPSKAIVLHAGGLYNAYSDWDEFTEAQKTEVKKAGVVVKEAFKENAQAKMNYVFCVVDNANASAGVQIAIETQLLGDKVKEVINDARESIGEEKGDPWKNPYAIQWIYRADEKVFNKKYHARRMETIKLTPEIAKLIRGPAPDLSPVIEPFNIQTLRATLERHCLIKGMPWDEIFTVEEDPEEEETTEESTPEVSTKGEPSDADEDVETDDEGDELVACDGCEKPMKATASECPHCEMKYNVEKDEEEEKPKPPPMKKRSEMKAEAAKGKKSSSNEDEIPFDSAPGV